MKFSHTSIPTQPIPLSIPLLITGIFFLNSCQNLTPASPQHLSPTTITQPTHTKKIPTTPSLHLQKKDNQSKPNMQATRPTPTPILNTNLQRIKHAGISFTLVCFDSRNHQLIVADQPAGPGSQWKSAADAAKAKSAIAAINAGFFTPEGKPLGLVICDGKQRGYYNKSSLGSGIYYLTDHGAAIVRRSHWSKLKTAPPRHLLQAGPMLLEKGKSIAGLSSKSTRPRSFIATDGNYHWCIGIAEDASLAQLSKALNSINIPNFKPTTALNLDGGRSSDLWTSTSINGGPANIRGFFNKPVRNFLILKPNPKK